MLLLSDSADHIVITNNSKSSIIDDTNGGSSDITGIISGSIVSGSVGHDQDHVGIEGGQQDKQGAESSSSPLMRWKDDGWGTWPDGVVPGAWCLLRLQLQLLLPPLPSSS